MQFAKNSRELHLILVLKNYIIVTPTRKVSLNPKTYRIVVSYLEYIKHFSWNVHKYSTKRSLLELTAIIQKKMKDHDDLLKKHQEEQNQIRTKLGSYLKKEGGNLAVRDYTDDIYTQGIAADLFVES